MNVRSMRSPDLCCSALARVRNMERSDIAFAPSSYGLIAQTEALQERRCLGILHRRGLVSGVDHRRRDLPPCILLLSGLRPMISLGSDLCSCILHGPDPSVLLHGPDRRRRILHHRYGGSLRSLCRRGLCPCLFLGCPRLELLEQGLIDWLALGLALLGRLALLGSLALLGGLAPLGRFNSRCNFVARRRVRCRRRQILRAGE